MSNFSFDALREFLRKLRLYLRTILSGRSFRMACKAVLGSATFCGFSFSLLKLTKIICYYCILHVNNILCYYDTTCLFTKFVHERCYFVILALVKLTEHEETVHLRTVMSRRRNQYFCWGSNLLLPEILTTFSRCPSHSL